MLSADRFCNDDALMEVVLQDVGGGVGHWLACFADADEEDAPLVEVVGVAADVEQTAVFVQMVDNGRVGVRSVQRRFDQ